MCRRPSHRRVPPIDWQRLVVLSRKGTGLKSHLCLLSRRQFWANYFEASSLEKWEKYLHHQVWVFRKKLFLRSFRKDRTEFLNTHSPVGAGDLKDR
jgi:hypothetical protein